MKKGTTRTTGTKGQAPETPKPGTVEFGGTSGRTFIGETGLKLYMGETAFGKKASTDPNEAELEREAVRLTTLIDANLADILIKRAENDALSVQMRASFANLGAA